MAHGEAAMAVTAKQRYWRAVREARLMAEANLVLFMAGKIDVLPCAAEIERDLIMVEIEKAMQEK